MKRQIDYEIYLKEHSKSAAKPTKMVAMEWNADPEIFRKGAFAVRWYGLLFSGAFYFAYIFLKKVFAREKRNPQDVDILLYLTISLTLVGSRLAHCLFYQWDYFSQNPIKIFYIWEGGLASHGAVLGLMLAGYIYSRIRPHQSFLWLADRIILTTCIGGAMIRLGNFFNSEIVGRPSDVTLAVTFLRVDNIARHPVQLYESAFYLLLGLFLMRHFNNYYKHRAPGFYFAAGILGIFMGRFCLEFFKESPITAMGLTTGQLLSIPFVLISGISLYRLQIK